MLLNMPRTNDDDQSQARRVVTARVDPVVFKQLEKLATATGRSVSRLIELACLEISGLSPDEINKRIMRAAKSR